MFLFLFIAVLIPVVCSIFSMFRILVVFCFQYCIQLLVVFRFSLVCFTSHFHVNESCVSCLCVF